MGISISSAQSQANSLRAQASAVRDLANDLLNEKSDLNVSWQAGEMRFLNEVIERIAAELGKLSGELDSIAGDVISVAHEIKAEEEAKAEAERQARLAYEAYQAQQLANAAKSYRR
ncbi:hypothetical protein [Cohnella panacarvi]|uniref:hypothetical protein n=1 Tax=Cohnella panacarvi TaxID=400776 RepID=UPI000478694A|nr:hypothetical protein [Cohnella panacarvi]